MFKNTEKGYTLVEKLVVAGIAGIIASIAVPSFIGFVNAQAVRSDAESIERQLRGAQSEAKKQVEESELKLADCQTDSDCDMREKEWKEHAMCEAMIQALKPSNKLLWEMWRYGYLIVFEDGTCSMVSNPLEFQKRWGQSASDEMAPSKKGE